MKMPMAWHEECLRNQRTHYERELARLKVMQDELERTRVDINIYEYQIAKAKEQGKDGFDREKFNRKRAGMNNGEAK